MKTEERNRIAIHTKKIMSLTEVVVPVEYIAHMIGCSEKDLRTALNRHNKINPTYSCSLVKIAGIWNIDIA